MNRDKLRGLLRRIGVREDAYSLDGGHLSGAYVLAHEGSEWRVYYSERGQESTIERFSTEADGCQELLRRLLDDATTRS
jgi:hypothetical protein